MEAQARRLPQPRTLAQEIDDILAELIVGGQLQPGQKLQEEQLCSEYGFTRTPLREAMHALASRGLLEYFPNRGCRVRVIGAAELIQIYQAREALEGMAARLLAANVTDEQIARLRGLAEVILTGPVTAESMAADWQLHTRIADWSGNAVIRELLLTPQVLTRAMLGSQTSPVIPPAPTSDHRLVVEAIASREPERAEAAMRAHLRGAAERTLASFEALSGA